MQASGGHDVESRPGVLDDIVMVSGGAAGAAGAAGSQTANMAAIIPRQEPGQEQEYIKNTPNKLWTALKG